MYSLVRSNTFHVYDQETREAIEAFVAPFARTTAHPEFFHDMSGDQVRFVGDHEYLGQEAREAELKVFKQAVRDGREAFSRLVTMVRDRWRELDVGQLRVEAKRLRADFARDVAALPPSAP